MQIIKRALKIIQKPVLTVFIAVFAVSGVVFAQSAFTQPASAPPNGNVSAPINVGATFQQKVGDLWARKIGTDSGYCIGDSCITEWPVASPMASCQLCVSIVPDTGNDNSKARQCGTGAASQVLCAPLDQWTTPYRDDTDDRKGGCQMQWKLDCTAPYGDRAAPAPPTYTGDGNDEVTDRTGGHNYEPAQTY
ncbi:hypothetical protein KJ848_01635 [Patescibacteria group bacterium]|nr:hypothetical protein [Patescibacteria group bacterium]MBU2158863.1 hypothetical protein [Patescibacteria group bacterium]